MSVYDCFLTFVEVDTNRQQSVFHGADYYLDTELVTEENGFTHALSCIVADAPFPPTLRRSTLYSYPDEPVPFFVEMFIPRLPSLQMANGLIDDGSVSASPVSPAGSSDSGVGVSFHYASTDSLSSDDDSCERNTVTPINPPVNPVLPGSILSQENFICVSCSISPCIVLQPGGTEHWSHCSDTDSFSSGPSDGVIPDSCIYFRPDRDFVSSSEADVVDLCDTRRYYRAARPGYQGLSPTRFQLQSQQITDNFMRDFNAGLFDADSDHSWWSPEPEDEVILMEPNWLFANPGESPDSSDSEEEALAVVDPDSDDSSDDGIIFVNDDPDFQTDYSVSSNSGSPSPPESASYPASTVSGGGDTPALLSSDDEEYPRQE